MGVRIDSSFVFCVFMLPQLNSYSPMWPQTTTCVSVTQHNLLCLQVTPTQPPVSPCHPTQPPVSLCYPNTTSCISVTLTQPPVSLCHPNTTTYVPMLPKYNLCSPVTQHTLLSPHVIGSEMRILLVLTSQAGLENVCCTWGAHAQKVLHGAHRENRVLEEQHRKAFTVHFHNTISKIKKKRQRRKKKEKK